MHPVYIQYISSMGLFKVAWLNGSIYFMEARQTNLRCDVRMMRWWPLRHTYHTYFTHSCVRGVRAPLVAVLLFPGSPPAPRRPAPRRPAAPATILVRQLAIP